MVVYIPLKEVRVITKNNDIRAPKRNQLKSWLVWLAGVAQWTEHWPVN